MMHGTAQPNGERNTVECKQLAKDIFTAQTNSQRYTVQYNQMVKDTLQSANN